MSDQQPGFPLGDERASDSDATREIRRPTEPSPWSRESGTPVFPPSFPAYRPPDAPEPRFAGQPYTQQVYGQPTPQPPYGQPYTQPWESPTGPPTGFLPPDVPPTQHRGPGVRILVALLIVALLAGLTTVLVTTTSSKKNAGSASGSDPLPGASAAPAPTTPPTPSPSSSLPPLGLIATPPALLRIGYHAYSSGLLSPSDIALGPQELVLFKKYGLSRTVSLRALTLGDLSNSTDDYDATINVLKFADAAGAKAELDYSNTQNKKDAPVIALPGLPDATGFYNKPTATAGLSIGAFATSGRYQVVVILSGLLRNDSTNQRVFAAEAARVMKAVLPIAATIEPSASSGTTPQIPGLATPSPSGTHA